MKEKRKQILGNWRNTKQQNPSNILRVEKAAISPAWWKAKILPSGNLQCWALHPQSGNQLHSSLKPKQCQEPQPGGVWGGAQGLFSELQDPPGNLPDLDLFISLVAGEAA